MAQIRMLDEFDWELLRDVRLRSLEDSPENFGSTYDRELAFTRADWDARLRSTIWFLASVDDEPVGVAGILTLDPMKPMLIGLWVEPGHRGAGIADDLFAVRIEHVKASGATAVVCGIAIDNERAYRFHQRNGFVPTGETELLREGSDKQIRILELRLS